MNENIDVIAKFERIAVEPHDALRISSDLEYIASLPHEEVVSDRRISIGWQDSGEGPLYKVVDRRIDTFGPNQVVSELAIPSNEIYCEKPQFNEVVPTMIFLWGFLFDMQFFKRFSSDIKNLIEYPLSDPFVKFRQIAFLGYIAPEFEIHDYLTNKRFFRTEFKIPYSYSKLNPIQGRLVDLNQKV